MQLIQSNDGLIAVMKDDLSLISAQILRISIYDSSNLLSIDVELKLRYRKDSNKILLRFAGVEEYSLYYHSHWIFYNVEIVKFFAYDNGFYISFDPVDESETISDEDQDYVKARSVQGFFL